MDPLRAYIRSVLGEQAGKKHKHALGGVDPGTYGSMEGMALMIDPARHSTLYVLYKPRYYAARMKKGVGDAREEFAGIRFKGDYDEFKGFYSFANIRDIFRDPDGIYGYLAITSGRQMGLAGTCNRANEVTHVSARKGYSTFMYEIALLRHSPIMPDREGVSKNARHMWKYFAEERADVEKEPFKNEKGLHQKTEEDCSIYGYKPLDQSYSREQKYHIENLKRKHDMFLEQMKKYLKDNGVDFIKSRINEYLVDAGKIFYESEEEGWGPPKEQAVE